MKRFTLLIPMIALSACVSDNPEEKNVSLSPNKDVISLEKTKSNSVPQNMTTADYMTEQENELKESLAETSVQVVRSNNILAVILPADVVFGSNEGQPDATAEKILQKISVVLSRYHKTRISIIGYADSGVPQTDRKVSEERAQTVAGILKKYAKISPVRFWIEGSMPPDSGENEDQLKNNHVDIILIPTFIR